MVSPARVDRRQPSGQDAEQLVAGRMAERVVHALEVVDVHEQDGNRIGAAFGLTQGEVEAVEEQRPVRETGQRVVQPLVGEVGFGPDAVRDVQHGPDDAMHAGRRRRNAPPPGHGPSAPSRPAAPTDVRDPPASPVSILAWIAVATASRSSG